MFYVTGDVHGDFSRFRAASRLLKKGDVLFICGDFGMIWDNGPREQRQLKRLAKKPYTIAFLDGQHENYDLLAAYPTVEWGGAPAQQIAPNIFHLLRGQIYTVEGRTFFTFGGGESESPEWRRQAQTVWPDASPSEQEMLRGLHCLRDAGATDDYVLTHEPSGRVRSFFDPDERNQTGLGLYLNYLEERITFRHWYFGCIHTDKRLSRKYTALFLQIRRLEE